MCAKRKDRSLNQLVAAYLRSGPEEERSVIEYLRDHNPYLLAHHPAAACFRDHVWYFGGFFWCKGCVMAAAGALAGLALQIATAWLDRLEVSVVAATFAALLAPTLLCLLFTTPRVLKHTARSLLGFTTASAALYLFVTDSWLVRAAIIVCFFAIRQPLVRYLEEGNRKILRRNTEDESS